MWLPHTTVATIIEEKGKFLMVHEHSDGEIVYNQPAGHLDPNESLVEACVRETYEETGWHIAPNSFLGVSQYTAPTNGVTYIRHSFVAQALNRDVHAELDKGIIEAVWLTYEEILSKKHLLRSPVVLGDIEKYRLGHAISLDLLTFY